MKKTYNLLQNPATLCALMRFVVVGCFQPTTEPTTKTGKKQVKNNLPCLII